MASFFNPKHRSIVPRWRLYNRTAALKELRAGTRRKAQDEVRTPADQLRDWNSHKTIWHAADLLGAAVVSNQPEVAREAAEFLIAQGSGVTAAALSLARRVTDPRGTLAHRPTFGGDWRGVIQSVRAYGVCNARSAVRWADFGLAHTVLGNAEHAIRALTVAVALAPDNRFVLRSAARCFLHWGEADRAHDILRRSPATSEDPWLLAAEIGIASARRRTSGLIAVGRQMVKEGSFSSAAISELACGIGTVEFEAGSLRHARPMLGRSLEAPTENVVAQVEWMLNKKNQAMPRGALYLSEVPLLFEAKATEHYNNGEWEASMSSALGWLADQPFSSRPADLASYVASLLGRFEDAVRILEGARYSNPEDQILLNNLAYFSAMAGDLPSAVRWMRMVKWDKLDQEDRAVLTATAGLLKFRAGEPDVGRRLYQHTVQEGIRMRDPRLQCIALLNLAREELIAGDADLAVEHFRESQSLAKRVHGEDITTMLSALESRLERRAAPARC